MSCELCKGHEVSHKKMRAVSPSLRHFMGGSASGGLGWVTSLFPASPHTSLYRSRDDRTNVLSRLNLYFFSRDKQKRITTNRLMWCFSNCGPCNSLTLCTYEWKRQLHWPTWTRVIGSLCAVKLTSVFLWLIMRHMASIEIVWYLLRECDIFYFHLLSTLPCSSSSCQNFLLKVQDLERVRKLWLKVLCHFQEQQ